MLRLKISGIEHKCLQSSRIEPNKMLEVDKRVMFCDIVLCRFWSGAKKMYMPANSDSDGRAILIQVGHDEARQTSGISILADGGLANFERKLFHEHVLPEDSEASLGVGLQKCERSLRCRCDLFLEVLVALVLLVALGQFDAAAVHRT